MSPPAPTTPLQLPGARSWIRTISREAAKIANDPRSARQRINSQALELGIERPKLRNGAAITNQNTLTYVLINLRGLHRVRAHKAELARQEQPIAGR